MEAVRLNISGNRQNIDLPENMNFSDDDLCAAKIGDAVIIMPRKSVRAIMRQGLNRFSPDYGLGNGGLDGALDAIDRA